MTTENGKGNTQAQAIAVGADNVAPRRRGFLLGAGVAAGAAGVAAVALVKRTQPASADVLPQAATQAPVEGRGYHETAHVRKYYDTTKV